MSAAPCLQSPGNDDPWAANLHSLRLEELVDASRTAGPWPRGLPGPTPDEAKALGLASEVVHQVDDIMMALVLCSTTLMDRAAACLDGLVHGDAILAALAARRLRRLMVSPWLAAPARELKPSDAMRSALAAVLTRLDAVRADSGGVSPVMQTAAAEHGRSAGVSSPPLSARELQVARCVSMGMTNKQIAIQLKLSPNTIKRHLARILRRLNLGKRSAVASWYAVRQPAPSQIGTMHDLAIPMARSGALLAAAPMSPRSGPANLHQ